MRFSTTTFLATGFFGLTAILGLAAHNAQAAGFYIQEQSVSGLGAAFSGATTTLHDASTIYFNPAGMTKLNGGQAQLGVNVIAPIGEMTNTGSTVPLGAIGGDGDNPYSPTPVPNFFASQQITDNVWVGLGVTAPFGLDNKYDSDWFGRYDSTKTMLHTHDIQPTVAWKVNEQLSVGAGINIQRATADLRNVALPSLLVGEVESKLKGEDWGYGYSAGLQYTPFDGTTFGASYRSSVHYDLKGRATAVTLAGNSLVSDTQASASLTTPDIASFGASQRLGDKWTVMGNVNWFGWNNYDKIQPINSATGAVITTATQNYQTTWAFSLGAEYAYNDAWTFRGGMQFDETPTTDEYRNSRTPDGDRIWASLGATYSLNDRLAIDLAATYIDVSNENISVVRNGGFSTINAKTDGSVVIGALALTYKF